MNHITASTAIHNLYGKIPHVELEALPNLGREAQTIVHHILKQMSRTNYFDINSDFAPYTMFLQGNPYEHVKLDSVLDSFEKLEKNGRTAYPLGIQFQADWRGKPNNPTPGGIPIADYFQELFGYQPKEPHLTFYYGAQFIIPRGFILSKSPYFYRKMYQRLMNPNEQQLQTSAPWPYEMMWCQYIFNPALQIWKF